MTDTTQEQLKLTLADKHRFSLKEIENIAKLGDPYSASTWMVRALIASQTALRSGCIGCQEGWPFDGTNAFGEPNHAIPIGRLNDVTQYWDHCYLTDEQRAALLDQGDGDAP